jgi:hypothetical protein
MKETKCYVAQSFLPRESNRAKQSLVVRSHASLWLGNQSATAAELVALLLSVRSLRKCANLKKVQAFQCDTF